MRRILKIVEDNRASTGIRFSNYIIDSIVLIIVNMILSFIALFLYEITALTFFDFYNNGGLLWEIVSGNIICAIYYYLWERFSDGRTVGKYLTNTKVISTDGLQPSAQQILYRSLSRIVPFDAISFLGGGNGWHDSWSDTRVIDIKKYNAERQTKEEINSIGEKEIA
ncbi:hypothetical protein CHRYSEOSP005_07310 [Chryseobacterium sp. Alg-005]|uniref:RDD family protein n=1 Tax=Chryseobacterium sp. Alg-005 TaxID=3159516 RepID=UPI003555B658